MDNETIVAQGNTETATETAQTTETTATVDSAAESKTTTTETSVEPAKEPAKEQTRDEKGQFAKVPESYTMPAIPEGFSLDQPLFDEFVPIAKEMGLSQESLQKVVEFSPKLIAAYQAKQQESQQATYQANVDAIKASYGQKFEENIGKVNGLLKEYGGDAITTEVEAAGLYGNKSLIDALLKIAEAAGPGKFIKGQSAHADMPMKTILFGDMSGE